jgi:hypothetical protein
MKRRRIPSQRVLRTSRSADDGFPGRHVAADFQPLDVALQGGEIVLDFFDRLPDRMRAAAQLFVL